MTNGRQAEPDGIKIFISYARKDLEFAERIVAALGERGVATKIDTRDLPKLEDWREELLGFIRAADTVIFIVSEHSISSPMCEWEVEQVARLNKRLAPIVLERVQDDHIPADIAKINYIFFDPPNDFEARADELTHALQSDLDWLKEHTRLGELARRWDERRRSSWLKLRGQELRDAERWIAMQPTRAPHPSDLHREFIRASRRNQIRNRRLAVMGASLVVVIALGLGAFVEWPAAFMSDWIGRKIQADTQFTLRFEGPTSVRLFPYFIWRAESANVSTFAEVDTKPLVAVKSIEAQANLFSLVWSYVTRRRLAIPAISFHEPVVIAMVDKTGRNNWSGAKPLPEQALSIFEFGGIEVRNGQAVFFDESQNSQEIVSDINILPDRIRIGDSLESVFTFVKDNQKFNGGVIVDSILGLFKQSGTQVFLRLDNAREHIDLRARIAVGDTPRISGTVETSNVDLSRYFPTLKNMRRPRELRAASTQLRDDPLLVVKSLKAFLEALDSGAFVRTTDDRLSPIGPSDVPSSVSDEPLDMKFLRRFNIDLVARMADVRLDESILGNFETQVTLNEGRLSVRGRHQTIIDGRLEFDAKVDASVARPTLATSVSAEMEASEMFERVGMAEPLSGRLKLATRLSGDLVSLRELLGSLTGRLEAQLTHGSIRGYDLNRWWAYLDRSIAFDEKISTTFHQLDARIELQHGVVQNAYVSVDGPLIVGKAQFTGHLLSNEFRAPVDLVYKPLGWRFTGRICCAWSDAKLQQIAGAPQGEFKKFYPDDPQLPGLMKRVLDNPRHRETLGSNAVKMLQDWQRRVGSGGG